MGLRSQQEEQIWASVAEHEKQEENFGFAMF